MLAFLGVLVVLPVVLRATGNRVPVRIQEASVPPPATPAPGPRIPNLTVEDRLVLRRQFEKGDYRSLEETLAALQAAMERDIDHELRLRTAIGAFDRPTDRKGLDEWVRKSPKSWVPYLARAEHHRARAGAERGTDWAQATPRENFERMDASIADAQRDIDAALRLDPRLLTAYVLRLELAKLQGDETAEELAFADAMKVSPKSFHAYDAMVGANTPRWGGSYQRMDELARQAVASGVHRAEGLFGAIYADQASLLEHPEGLEQAMTLYTKALSYGDRSSYRLGRADVLCDMKRYDDALKDADAAVALYEEGPSLVDRSAIHAVLGRYDLSAADLRKAVECDPYDFDTYRRLDDVLVRQGKHDEVIEYWGRYLALQPGDANAYMERAGTYKLMNEDEKAHADVERAAELGSAKALWILKTGQ